MTRHPTARRVPRHSTAAPDDVFVERVLESTVWAKQNARILIISIGVVLLAAILFLWYRNTTSRLRDTAEAELSTIRQTVLAGNAPLAIRDLENFMASFGQTPAAGEARLLLGRAYMDNKEPQKAIDLLRPHSDDFNTPIGVETAMLLGAAMSSAAQPDAAIEAYLRVADNAPLPFQKQLALEAAARLRFEKGDSGGAVQLYDRILSILPQDSPDRAVYELRRAEAAARTPSTS